ncbi:hypothetical protein DFJ73DRAFT_488271 [Zopfochytrium polystomum]|nr:hypothetical protein DFJ73DRAFT_488271 [Zopfochytrium polystomum]
MKLAVTLLAFVAATASAVQAADMNTCVSVAQKFTDEVTKCTTGTPTDIQKCLCGIPTLADDYKAFIDACNGIMPLPSLPFNSVEQFQAICATAISGASSAGGASSTRPTSSAAAATTSATTKSGAVSVYAGATVFALTSVAACAAVLI